MTLSVRLPETIVDGRRLGRNIDHDPRSKAYRVERTATVESKRWTRRVGIFDQGQTGSCTGNAAVGVLGTDPFYETLAAKLADGLVLDEAEARDVYSAAERLDGGAGLPTEDQGSSGLSVAKVCASLGLISGYRHAFGFDDFTAGMQSSPCITGIMWVTGCDTPDDNGLVRWTGKARGGHEVEVDEIDVDRELVGFDNSWSTTFGVAGRFYMSFADYEKALADNGDATFFTPLTEPAPTPAPTPGPAPSGDALRTFAAVAGPWAAQGHRGANARMASATRAYLLAAAGHGGLQSATARRGHAYIDAGTGHFVSAAYAAMNPTTTVRIEH